MRDTNLINALRCVSTAVGPMGDCEKCLFYKTEPVPEDLAGKVNLTEWSSCDVDAVGFAAADRIANQSTHIAALQQEIEKLRAQLRHLCQNCDLDRLEKLAEADRAGRLVVLPVRPVLTQSIGSMLYIIEDGEIVEDSLCEALVGMGSNREINIFYTTLSDQISFEQADIGKTVFLTREKAEQALEAMKDE